MRAKTYRFKRWMNCFILSIFIVSAAQLSSCASSAPAFYTTKQLLDLSTAIHEVMSEYNVPGVIVGVWQGDSEPLILAVGEADTQTGRSISATDTFRIASVTKTFTATVILILVDEGKISLDDTLDQYYPQVPNSDIITIRQLLNMTAGVYDFYYHDPEVSSSYQNDPLRQWTDQELFDILISHEPAFDPGTQCVYSNANYFLLSIIAEQVTGNTIGEEIQTKIIQPLGLDNTSFPTTSDMTGNYTHGYRDDAMGVLEDITIVNPSLMGGAGAMISNISDLNTWVRALYGGTLLSSSVQQQRMQWVEMVSFLQYGLGVMNWGGYIGHNGEILGYNNFSLYLPDKDASIIVMTNKCDDDGGANSSQDLLARVIEILYPDNPPSATGET